MRNDGYCRDDVVATVSRRRRKSRESCRSFTCISPWFIFCRWFNGGDSKGSKNRVGKEWEIEKLGDRLGIKRKDGMMKSSMNHGSASSFAAENSEEKGKEASFNLGFGFGLVYLIAASRNELSKMMELHKQMEMFLHNVQTEFQNNKGQKRPVLMSSKSTVAPSFSNSDVQDTLLYSEEETSHQYLSSHIFESPEIGFDSNQLRHEKSSRIEHLEDELVAELDRLQLQMDTELILKYSKQQYSEEIMNLKDSAPEMSQSTSFEEIAEHQHEHQPEFSNQEYYGVHPNELERRLHEVLEARQEERIKELESAVEQAMHQLEMKERELCWWKDTVRLISQQAKHGANA